MNIALCQLRTELDFEQTMEKAEKMVCQAAKNGADIAVLPEMYCCPYEESYFERFSVTEFSNALSSMSRWASENRILLIGGSIPELFEGKLYNTSYVFDNSGNFLAKHRKVHLFDVDLPDMHFHESDSFSAGDQFTVFDTDLGKIGVAVCFDLRFPELFRAMAMEGASIIFVPAQFNTVTGPTHWDTLLKARALDNQVFVAACAAARYDGFRYECWGHSSVADPYGQVIASCDEKEQVLYAEIDMQEIQLIRNRLPVLSAMRPEVYAKLSEKKMV